MPAIAEAAAVTWPLAMTLASVAVADRVRAKRRRRSLNRALHELRRPLQALVLAPPARRAPTSCERQGHVELALDALAELDREVNGAAAAPRRVRRDGRTLAVEALERWRWPAAVAGRRLELVWRAGTAAVMCDPPRVARALDNLIANAVEHGRPHVRVEGIRREDRLRLLVADGVDVGPATATPNALVGGPRRRWSVGGARLRGHGLQIVAAIAAEHGGRFAMYRHGAGASAILELPLAKT